MEIAQDAPWMSTLPSWDLRNWSTKPDRVKAILYHQLTIRNMIVVVIVFASTLFLQVRTNVKFLACFAIRHTIKNLWFYGPLSLCHGFLLAVMHNHRGLEQYQACEDLSLPFNDKTSLEMRTWCIHKRALNDMTKWGSFLIPLAVSDRVILSIVRLQRKRKE